MVEPRGSYQKLQQVNPKSALIGVWDMSEFSKQINNGFLTFVLKWCLFTLPLELFFRDKARCEGISAPVSTVETPSDAKQSLVHKGFVAVLSSRYPPEYGRFLPRTRLTGCAWPIGHARPKTSLIAHAKTSSPTDGFTSKGQDVLNEFGRVGRVGAGA
jgi:hypothetical protein